MMIFKMYLFFKRPGLLLKRTFPGSFCYNFIFDTPSTGSQALPEGVPKNLRNKKSSER